MLNQFEQMQSLPTNWYMIKNPYTGVIVYTNKDFEIQTSLLPPCNNNPIYSCIYMKTLDLWFQYLISNPMDLSKWIPINFNYKLPYKSGWRVKYDQLYKSLYFEQYNNKFELINKVWDLPPSDPNENLNNYSKYVLYDKIENSFYIYDSITKNKIYISPAIKVKI